MTWSAIWILAAGTYAMKAIGPVALGRRELSPRIVRLFVLLAAALLAALVALSTFTVGDELTYDWPLVAGVAAAGLAILRRLPLVAVIVIAAVVAGLMRLV